MAINDWLAVLRREYLQDFVKNGGAGVKFVVPWEASTRRELQEGLVRMAAEEGYAFASVDSATTKVQLVDKVFNALARQIDWDSLAQDFLMSTLRDGQYLLPYDWLEFNLSNVALLNGLDVAEMRAIFNNRLRERLSRDFSMTHEFRQAMLKLCQAQLDPQDVGTGVAQAVREWLWGDLQLVSALKSAAIFQKIGRHNAREMISSLSHWLHVVGKSGLVISLDISTFLESNRGNVPGDALFYSTAAVVDGYEVLRQFVDSTDELQHCLIVVFAPPEFLNDEQRGLRKYDALYLRIWDEVKDRRKTNPLSSLIRFTTQEEPAESAAVGSRL
jgi:hypothetical protein